MNQNVNESIGLEEVSTRASSKCYDIVNNVTTILCSLGMITLIFA